MNSKTKWSLAAVASFIIVASSVTGWFKYNHHSATVSIVDLDNLQAIGKPTEQRKQAVFEQVWDIFDKNYPNLQFNGIDWAHEKSVFAPRALNTTSWTEFFSVVEQMINRLNDAQCYLIGEPLNTYMPLIFTTLVGNQVVVIWAPNEQNIPPDSIITAIDGEPVAKLIHTSGFTAMSTYERAQYIGWEITPSLEQLTIWNPSISQTIQTTVPVSSDYGTSNPYNENWIKAKQKNLHEAAAAVMHWYPNLQFITSDGEINVAVKVQVQHLAGNIIYICLPNFDPYQDVIINAFEKLIPEINHSKGLIIDVRENGGGGSWPAYSIARHFYTKPETPLAYRERSGTLLSGFLADELQQHLGRIGEEGTEPLIKVQNSNSKLYTPWVAAVLEPLEPRIKVPTAVLTTDGVSAAENFVAAIHVASNVKTFGQRTAGADGAPTTFPVMKGVTVSVSSWQERIASTGLPIENIGIAPDIHVGLTYSEFKREVQQIANTGDVYTDDPVLNAATKWIMNG